ncbi:alpha-L-fucosidase, partial [Arenibacter sp. ARW7G5Y1]|uniref:alpha-L-fucosidase n=1 Tax=Arenibacter sp. ARW7G5Y1 TaxID=2135619 RepID=UPI000D755A41
MKYNQRFLLILLIFCTLAFCEEVIGQAQEITLAKPSGIQYKWQEQERIMFLHFDPATWQKREFDDHSTPLERINPKKLDTDQWCEVAQSWGAKEILFVAKHVGGFCWWQTESTDYSIKKTSYKNGEGDVLKELSESCEKYGLNLGIYVYPGDQTWGAGIGSGGITADPAKQEGYNKVFRQQLTETLSNYGDVMEVWFDGSLKIDVSDIMEKYAKNSVVFQGPHATLRCPGTESGKLFYPAWNTVKKEDLDTGLATQIHGDPNGDVWAPLESNTTLYNHYWFWSPEKEKKRKSIKELMDIYYRSVGYGSVLLLNSTPDTTGLIPANDVKHYKEFAQEIDRRFKIPLAEVSDKQGQITNLTLPKNQKLNHVVIMEDYRQGHRIREYLVEGLVNGKWKELSKGTSVGRKKIDYFPDVEVSEIRLNVTRSVGSPLLRKLSAYYVENFEPPLIEPVHANSPWTVVGKWNSESFVENTVTIEIDLSDQIILPGQYTLRLVSDSDITITDVEIHYDNQKAMDDYFKISGNEVSINRTAMVTNESSSILYLTFESDTQNFGNVEF